MFKLVKDHIGKYLGYVIATIIVTILSYTLQIAFLFPESKRIIDEGVYNMDLPVIYQSGIQMLILSVAPVFDTWVNSKSRQTFDI